METGTPSLATLEAIQAMVPAQDRWPLSDTIAYHDWHFGGNGDIKTFMETLATRYGAGTEPRGLRAQGADDELRDLSRHVRRIAGAPVDEELRAPAVDDASRLAV